MLFKFKPKYTQTSRVERQGPLKRPLSRYSDSTSMHIEVEGFLVERYSLTPYAMEDTQKTTPETQTPETPTSPSVMWGVVLFWVAF